MDELIYDRTAQDVEYALSHPDDVSFLKGAYNYTDLNRVESWCQYLANLLTGYGYPVSIITKTNWTMEDFPTQANMERIRQNVQALKNAYYSTTSMPTSLENMTYDKANAIEKILNEIDTYSKNMIASFLYSGTFYSGESEVLI